jgi:hypothetical protein
MLDNEWKKYVVLSRLSPYLVLEDKDACNSSAVTQQLGLMLSRSIKRVILTLALQEDSSTFPGLFKQINITEIENISDTV